MLLHHGSQWGKSRASTSSKWGVGGRLPGPHHRCRPRALKDIPLAEDIRTPLRAINNNRNIDSRSVTRPVNNSPRPGLRLWAFAAAQRVETSKEGLLAYLHLSAIWFGKLLAMSFDLLQSLTAELWVNTHAHMCTDSMNIITHDNSKAFFIEITTYHDIMNDATWNVTFKYNALKF